MKLRARILLTLALALAGAASACSLVVGSLSECTTSADCAAKGAGLSCVDSLCVLVGPAVLSDKNCQSVFGADAGGEVIRIGAVVSKTSATGSVDGRGVPRQDAMEFAVEQLNLHTSIPGHSVVLRVCDDTSSNTVAATEAQELLDEGAVALVSSGSSQTIAIAANAVPAGAVVMSLSATSTQLSSAGVLSDGGAKRVWTTGVSDAFQAKVLTEMMLDGGAVGQRTAPFSHPVCINQDDIEYDGLYGAVAQDLLTATDGGVVMKAFTYAPGANVTATVQAAMATSPDAVLLIAPPTDSSAVFSAWTAADPAWLFTDVLRSTNIYAFDGGLTRLQGDQGTGPAQASPTSQVYLDFSQAYATQFGASLPDAGAGVPFGGVSYVPNAYDSVLLLGAGALWAQGHGGITGANIAQGLTQLSDTTATATPLEAIDFTAFQAAFAQGKQVNVAGASGALDFDPTTGVAPGPIDVWGIGPDGLSVLRTVNP